MRCECIRAHLGCSRAILVQLDRDQFAMFLFIVKHVT